MLKEYIYVSLLFVSLFFQSKIMADEEESLFALSSLRYYIESQIKGSEESTHFSEKDVNLLWEKARNGSDHSPEFIEQLANANSQCEAENFKKAALLLDELWKGLSDSLLPVSKKTSYYNDFDSNPHITHEARKKIKPYLLPETHPAKEALDSLFCSARATQDINTFMQAGFEIIKKTSRSFIIVAKHPILPGYLVKASLDSELRQKYDKPEWRWFVRRCEGAERIAKVINKKKCTLFTVSQKWIYPLPIEPSPPDSPDYNRKIVLLLVTDMHLVPNDENLAAWTSKITKKHLHELYEIISYAGGASYRPDNIAYTHEGTFAFIDTEYPHSPPCYDEIRKYLSPKMQEYWDKLVRKGGH